ncbi:MAG: sulfate ABC transporter substrate-binding protein [Dehalococcoidia bacterium]
MKHLRIRFPLLLLIVASLAAFLAVACGDDDDDTVDASPAAASSATTVAAAAGSATVASTNPAPSPSPGARVELINVSYDPTRELYAQYAELFAKHYKEVANVDVTVQNSHGGSGSQARSVVDGLQADVLTIALAGDTAVVEKAGLIEPGWEAEFPNNSNPYVSTIVLLVRKGNPKAIKDWTDLGKDGIGVITPNPKTSGGARWNFLAAWGSVTLNGGSEDQAKDLLARIYKNVKVLDSGARGSTQTFVDRGIGDVLIAWENEALLVTKDSDNFEIVYPKQSILAEPSVAVVDKNVDRKKTREVAKAFIEYLYSDEAQDLIARNFYRPSNATVLAKYRTQFPSFEKQFTIRDFGGWSAVATKFFAEGAIFDQIYKP